jgi:hypothetical protein
MIAQQYVQEFGNLAKTNNTIILPNDVSNVNQLVTQVYIFNYLILQLNLSYFRPFQFIKH